jgi:hypothetical protein
MRHRSHAGVRVGAFQILGEISRIETIAAGREIREIDHLQRIHGKGHWRKRKGIALVRFDNGRVCEAEVHWYEAHGIGRREFKVKRLLGVGP